MGYDGGLRVEGPIADFDGFYILCFHMVRKYKLKSDRDTWSVEGIIAAMHSIRNDVALCYAAASAYGVPETIHCVCLSSILPFYIVRLKTE